MSSQFAFNQLRKALDTSTVHPDAGVRERAAQRAEAWQSTLLGMAVGRIQIGSRAPVKDYPPWVTLEVNYGGFASGSAVGENIDYDERALGLKIAAAQPETGGTAVAKGETGQKGLRGKLFSHYLSDEGLGQLNTMLDTGAFRAEIPEETALLTIAWLLRAGDTEGAVQVIDAILPFAPRLRLAPRAAPPAVDRAPLGFCWRYTAEETREALRDIRAHPQLEVQRTVLSVWNPLSDRFLALWYPRVTPAGRVDAEPFDKEWLRTARDLVDSYDRAIKTHRPHSRRKSQNLKWLVEGTREAIRNSKLENWALDNRTNGRVRLAVDGMVRKRGVPGSESLSMLREHQGRIAAKPSTRTLGTIVAERFVGTNDDEGVQDPDRYAGPITSTEADKHHVPDGLSLPRKIIRVVRRTHAAPLDTLVAENSIPSAEIYGALLPNDVCRVVAGSYVDAALGSVMAANYTAFADRRSLLLLDYAHQVRVSELPWVIAADKHRRAADTNAYNNLLVHAAQTVMTNWPGTIVPNPCVLQLATLAKAIGNDIPLVEEVAADIFMGDFTAKFTRAAGLAAKVVQGTVYEKYYAIDTDSLLTAAEEPNLPNLGSFCRNRIDAMKLPKNIRASYVVANGEVIEQSQILTTHNLASFVTLGATADWYALATSAWATIKRLLRNAQTQPHPLGTIKNAAYAWRQALFFLSMVEKQEGTDVVRKFVREARKGVPAVPAARDRSPESPTEQKTEPSARRIARYDLIFNGLEDVLNGSLALDHQRTPNGRMFLGWSRGPHWIFMDDKTLKEREAAAAASSSGQDAVETGWKKKGDEGVSEWEAKIKAQYQGWVNPGP